MMTKIFALVAIIALSTAIPDVAVEPLPELVQVGMSAAEDAKATVDALIKSGKDQGACADLAAATIKEVTDSVNAQQQVLNGLDTGADCSKEGQAAVDAANQAISDAQKAKSDAESALSAALSSPVQFADMPLSSLKEGECGAFFSDAAYTAAKSNAESAKTTASQAAGALTAAEQALTAAQEEQKKQINNCFCRVKKVVDDAWTMANKNNDADAKAYTKGKHMACVLAGTPPADCSVGAVPTVTKPNLDAGVDSADCNGWSGTKCEKSVATYNNQGPYQLVGELPDGDDWEIEMDVKAKNDAHIGFSKTSNFPKGNNKMYELVLGGWGNSRVCLRQHQQGNCAANTNQRIMQGYGTAAKVKIARSGNTMTISGGAMGSPLVYNNYGAISDAKYVGIMTGWGSTGTWDICGLKQE